MSKNPLKVLMIGKGDAYHLEPLAQCIKAASPEIRLEVQGLREVTADGIRNYPDTSSVFDVVHQFPWSVSGRRQKEKSANSKATKHAPKYQPIWIESTKLFVRTLLSRKSSKHHRYFSSLLNKVDIIHLQSLFQTPALKWLLSNRNVPIIASCWGSEVLRQSDLFRTLNQQQLLRRASAITVTGSEFKEIVLSKYGRELQPKIHETFFNPQIEKFLSNKRAEASQHFKASLGVPAERTIVCIGHNGYYGGQHLDLIKSIVAIEENKKKSLFIIVPMTYGAGSEYQDLVNSTLQQGGLSGTVLKNFLTEEELRDFRLATDILIYAPVSDAFSATVSQALAAGSVTILGSWLPYKARKKAGFNYWEIDTPDEAGQMLSNILEDWPGAQLQSELNRSLSAKFFSQEKIGHGWINAYKSAIKHFKGYSQ